MVWKAMSIDVSKSILMVLGKPARPKNGLCIGSQLAAGGASLVAAWAEESALRQERKEVKAEIRTKCFIRRWLDDLWIMHGNRISAAAASFLSYLQSEHFYGPTFTLKRVWDGEPFGFSVILRRDGRVSVRSKLGFIQERRKLPGNGWQKDRSTMHGGAQFQSRTVKKATLTGHLIRYLDLSTEDEETMLRGVARVLTEMMRVGMDRKLIGSALRKLAFNDQPALKALFPVLEWGALAVEAYRRVFDDWDAAVKAGTLSSMASQEIRKLMGD